MKIKRSSFAMRCFRCETPWEGFGQPTPRKSCGSCGTSLHCCMNCHYFDRKLTNTCTLDNTEYVGPRDVANYCDEFRIIDSRLKAIEARTRRARNVWEDLFRA